MFGIISALIVLSISVAISAIISVIVIVIVPFGRGVLVVYQCNVVIGSFHSLFVFSPRQTLAFVALFFVFCLKRKYFVSTIFMTVTAKSYLITRENFPMFLIGLVHFSLILQMMEKYRFCTVFWCFFSLQIIPKNTHYYTNSSYILV